MRQLIAIAAAGIVLAAVGPVAVQPEAAAAYPPWFCRILPVVCPR